MGGDAPDEPRPKLTPASCRMEAGERVSGGPERTSFFSQISGAGRGVRMMGTSALASSVATWW
jgi:hypothetical protein